MRLHNKKQSVTGLGSPSSELVQNHENPNVLLLSDGMQCIRPLEKWRLLDDSEPKTWVAPQLIDH